MARKKAPKDMSREELAEELLRSLFGFLSSMPFTVTDCMNDREREIYLRYRGDWEDDDEEDDE